VTDDQRDAPRRPPLYARVLRLRHLRPSGLLCFLSFEGAIALAVLLALAELVPWWTVLVLPAGVAAMVKVNDLLAGYLAAKPVPAVASARKGGTQRVPEVRHVRHVSRDLAETLDPVDSPRQRFRQSARRRYR
jgi:hypothetical protein